MIRTRVVSLWPGIDAISSLSYSFAIAESQGDFQDFVYADETWQHQQDLQFTNCDTTED